MIKKEVQQLSMGSIWDSADPEKIEEPQVGYTKAAKTVVDQYDDPVMALIREVIQNFKDNRIKGEKAKFCIFVDERNKLIIFEEWGTTGIEDWDAFHGLWLSEKEKDPRKSGFVGQGKYVLLASCNDCLETETLLINKKHKRSVIPNSGIHSHKKIEDQDLIKERFGKRNLYHVGSRFVLHDVKEEILNRMLNFDELIRIIQATWNPLLKDISVEIKIALGLDNYQPVTPFSYPISKKGFEKYISDLKIEWSSSNSIITNCYIAYTTDVVDPYLQGIELIVRDQIIEHYQPDVRHHVDGVFVGYLDANFLREEGAEKPNHSGFKKNMAVWQETKKNIENICREIVKPLLDKRKQKQRKFERRDEQILRELNQALDKIPQLNFFSSQIPLEGDGEENDEDVVNKPKITSIKIEPQQNIIRGTSIQIEMEISNETSKNWADLEVQMKVTLPNTKSTKKSYNIPLLKLNETKLINEKLRILKKFPKGKYLLNVSLFAKKKVIHRRIASFWVESAIKRQRSPQTDPFISRIRILDRYILKRGQNVEILFSCKNPALKDYKNCVCEIVIFNPKGKQINDTYQVYYFDLNQDQTITKEYLWRIPSNSKKGQYVALIRLKDSSGELDKRRGNFLVDWNPFEKNPEEEGSIEGQGRFQSILGRDLSNLPGNPRGLLYPQTGTILINSGHAEYSEYAVFGKNASNYDSYIARTTADSLWIFKFNSEFDNLGDKISPDIVKNLIYDCQKLGSEFYNHWRNIKKSMK